MGLSAQGLVTDGLGKWGSSQQCWRALPGPHRPLFLSFPLILSLLFFPLLSLCNFLCLLPFIPDDFAKVQKPEKLIGVVPTLDCFIHANRRERGAWGEEKTEKREEDEGGNRERLEERCSNWVESTQRSAVCFLKSLLPPQNVCMF